MAVTKVKTNSGMVILTKLGVSASLIQSLAVHDIQILSGVSDLGFYKGVNKIASCSLPVTLSLIMKGNATMAQLAESKKIVESAFATVVSAAEANMLAQKSVPLPSSEPITLEPAEAMVETSVESSMATDSFTAITGKNWKNMPVVDLVQAGVMYQRVKGSSVGSIYRVVAISKDGQHKVAARIEHTKLSVRLESKNPSALNPTELTELGLTKKGDYWSCHVNMATKELQKRVLGSILMGLPFPSMTVLPDMEVLCG